MNTNRDEMLKEVMAADFTAIDLNLYLDTHPYDVRAMALFNASIQKCRILRDRYERMYGPLTASDSYGCPWQWINSPWPWEKQ